MTLAQVKSNLKSATGSEATVAEIAQALTYTAVLREIGAQIEFLRRREERSAQVAVPSGKAVKPPKPQPAQATKPKVG
jgi:hypothetical protein